MKQGRDVPSLAQRRLRDLLERIPEESRGALAESVLLVVEEAVSRERTRCVRACRDRAETWRTTTAARSAVAIAREEARARANEAQYLADLLEAGGEGAAGICPTDPNAQ